MVFIFHIWEWYGIIIPTDELIFLRGVGIPPTRLLHWLSRLIGIHIPICFFSLVWPLDQTWSDFSRWVKLFVWNSSHMHRVPIILRNMSLENTYACVLPIFIDHVSLFYMVINGYHTLQYVIFGYKYMYYIYIYLFIFEWPKAIRSMWNKPQDEPAAEHHFNQAVGFYQSWLLNRSLDYDLVRRPET